MKKLFSYLFLSLLVMGVASCSDDALEESSILIVEIPMVAENMEVQ